MLRPLVALIATALCISGTQAIKPRSHGECLTREQFSGASVPTFKQFIIEADSRQEGSQAVEVRAQLLVATAARPNFVPLFLCTQSHIRSSERELVP